MKKIAILGSTGSIGRQTVDIVLKNKDKFEVTALACNSDIGELGKQIELLKPKKVFVNDEKKALEIKKEFDKLEVLNGEAELVDMASKGEEDIVLNALVGIAGLKPTYYACKNGKTIALANKESMVTGGYLVKDIARANNSTIIPVDSEHSAIFQSIQGNEKKFIKRIILTASGGPFRNKTIDDLQNVTIKQALNHPNWSMGRKISIDSATLMNKALEIIEAKELFDIEPNQIHVMVHPQSILHSAVEYVDGSIIGQMGRADMRVPIAYSLSYPNRLDKVENSLDFFKEAPNLTFEEVDRNTFKTIDLAYYVMEKGLAHQIALNGANEVLVDAFLNERIKFLDIQNYLEKVVYEFDYKKTLGIDEVFEIDKEVRKITNNIIEKGSR